MIPPSDERALRELFEAGCGLHRRLTRESRRAERRGLGVRAQCYAEMAGRLGETLGAAAQILTRLGVAGVEPHRIP